MNRYYDHTFSLDCPEKAWSVLGRICFRADEKTSLYYESTQNLVARLHRISKSTVYRHVQFLIHHGYITELSPEEVRRHGIKSKAKCYRVNDPHNWPGKAAPFKK